MTTTVQQSISHLSNTTPLYPEDEPGITIREKYKRMFSRLAQHGLTDDEMVEAQTFPGGADELLRTLVTISLAMSVTGSTTRTTK